MGKLEIDNLISNPINNSNFCSENYKNKISKKYIRLINNINDEYEIVIMAAGKGTRMNLSYPKPLYQISYPNGKKPILMNLLETIRISVANISSIKIVINEIDRDFFKEFEENDELIQLIALKKSQIKGTAKCLQAIQDKLNSKKNIMLFWGDLGLIPASFILVSSIIHQKFSPLITMPTRFKKNPYVGLLRDKNGIFNRIFHSKESEQYYGFAEQDCLFFILNKDIFPLLNNYLQIDGVKNKKEVDFINLIPWLSQKNTVLGLPISNGENVNGINNVDKANLVESYLHNFSKEEYKNNFFNLRRL
tara:strand:+ start:9098 stop:10015 length:918 start_codon:yes stop_codon:yes gene_type:complete